MPSNPDPIWGSYAWLGAINANIRAPKSGSEDGKSRVPVRILPDYVRLCWFLCLIMTGLWGFMSVLCLGEPVLKRRETVLELTNGGSLFLDLFLYIPPISPPLLLPLIIHLSFSCPSSKHGRFQGKRPSA